MRTICILTLMAAIAVGQTDAPRVAQDSAMIHAIAKAAPVYPAEAKAAKLQGLVKLDVLIGADGRVAFVKPLEGPAALVQSAVDAVSQWVYQPVLLNGAPTAVMTQVDVNFTLQQ